MTVLGNKLSAVDIIGLIIITLGVIGMDLWGIKGPEEEKDKPETSGRSEI